MNFKISTIVSLFIILSMYGCNNEEKNNDTDSSSAGAGYIKLTNAVTFNDSNLTWEDTIDVLIEGRDWYEANTYCENLDLEGHSDWRQASLGEQRALYESGGNSAFTNSPINNDNYLFWTSTDDMLDSSDAYGFNHSQGVAITGMTKVDNIGMGDSYGLGVRCVRSNQ